MPTLLRIGYQYYAMKNEAAALLVIKGMIGSVRMDAEHADGKEVFWPDPDYKPQISVETVRSEQILRAKPDKKTVEVESRRVIGWENKS